MTVMTSAIADPVKTDFMIGADPEFAFVDSSNRLIPANTLVKDDELHEPFGYDGCARIAEVRPAPSNDPFTLVSNIKRDLDYGVAKNPGVLNCNWRAGSYVAGNPLGGHIHFGLGGIDGFFLDSYHDELGHESIGHVVLDALDRYLTHTLILLEKPLEAARRRASYGLLNAHRVQKWGIEYRSPSSWMTSPYIAAGALCLAKTVVWEVINNNLDHTYKPELDRDAFNNCRKGLLRPHFINEVWPEIQKFELYRKYKRQIDMLAKLIANKQNWFPACGMKSAWGISKNTKPLPKIQKTTLSDIWNGVEDAV